LPVDAFFSVVSASFILSFSTGSSVCGAFSPAMPSAIASPAFLRFQNCQPPRPAIAAVSETMTTSRRIGLSSGR
jgi:hypothetical protein